MNSLVLSIFPGIDLLGRGFEQEGFCVVRGPDTIWGGDVRRFHPPRGKFAGVIGGPPCQKISNANLNRDPAAGMELIFEFGRIVAEAGAEWFLMEEVPAVPRISLAGYAVQRFTLTAAECGGRQIRNRCFHFGSRDGTVLVCDRGVTDRSRIEFGAWACEGRAPTYRHHWGQTTVRRTWADFCEIQGLPRDFEIPGLGMAARYKAVGNGVPVYMAATVARAVRQRHGNGGARLCACECGRIVTGRLRAALPSCRKRLQRRRDNPSVTELTPSSAGASRVA